LSFLPDSGKRNVATPHGAGPTDSDGGENGVRDNEPNWGLAFGSGSFLIVWCLGFAADVPFETLMMRATVGAVLGTLLGVMVGYTLTGLRTLREDLDKGARVDFTVGEDEEPLLARPEAAPRPTAGADGESREAVVPQAPEPEHDPFKPIDYKAAAKQVQSVTPE
jgi:hypothetical protein